MNLTPALRFKEFKKSPPWETKQVNQIGETGRGRVINKQNLQGGKLFPVYSSQTSNNGIFGYLNTYDFEGNYITWTTDGANAGKVFYREGKFNCTNVCGTLKVNESKTSPQFVALSLNQIAYKYVSKIGNNKLMNNVFQRIIFLLPTLPEQEKIADLLSRLDNLIESENNALQQLEKTKKGLLQKLFPKNKETLPLLRFKEFKKSPPWDVKPLGEVVDIIGGGTPSTEESSYWNGNINWFTPSEIGKSKFVDSSIRKISKSGLQNSSAKILPSGTILLTTRATLGEMSILSSEATTNQGFQNIIVNQNVNRNYIFYLQFRIKYYCFLWASGSTFLEISSRYVKVIPIPLPTLPEQEKIATVLSRFDDLLEQQKLKIKALEKTKKGLLQKLFPSLK